MKITRPNAFLIGGPRCGTTSLSQYLGEHPNIFWSTPKGPGYFSFDFENYRYVKSIDEYHSCFAGAGAGAGHGAVCEGSTWYLYSREAVPRILEYDPDARFLVMLRNPVDQVPSYHNVLLSQGNEDIPDVETAWDLQQHRKDGKNIPKTCLEPSFLYYGDVARFGAQIERLLEIVGRGKVHIILYDDFITDTARVYRETLEFLGLPWDGRSEFETVNPGRVMRSRFLSRLAANPSALRLAVAGLVKRTLGIERIGFSDLVQRINHGTTPLHPVSPQFKARLQAFFRDDIDKLSRLLDRDLGFWYGGGRDAPVKSPASPLPARQGG